MHALHYYVIRVRLSQDSQPNILPRERNAGKANNELLFPVAFMSRQLIGFSHFITESTREGSEARSTNHMS